MKQDRDVYRSANFLIQQRGLNGAVEYVCDRADETINAGDLEGTVAWQRLLKALRALTTPLQPGEWVN
jgi:hypothetical protein